MNAIPTHDDACGDMLTLDKALAAHGWARASVVVARAAIEHAVEDVVADHGLGGDLPPRHAFRDLLDRLEAAELACRRFRRDLGSWYSDASEAAHGKPVSLYQAVQLVTTAAEFRRGLVSVYRQERWRPSAAIVERRSAKRLSVREAAEQYRRQKLAVVG